MKKYFLFLFLLPAVLMQAAVELPDVGNGRIRVLGNNLQNYYFNYNTGRGDYTPEELAEKTSKIVNAMLTADADIYAFCEVEAKPIVLQQLADSMNVYCGVTGRYSALDDGINEEWNEQYDNNIKSGFIYRTDKVRPYGSNYAATTTAYYKNTMRIQAWEEIVTGEKFTLSMNHFKAGQTDNDKSKRTDNATWLMNGLPSKAADPDILIMGDLNCQMDEDAISIILNAGYVEQLLRFDENAYSYVYYSNQELIDHAFANSTMADQITGAGVWHVNTSEAYYNRYSDHDLYLVALNLGGEIQEDSCQSINFSETFGVGLGGFEPISIYGESSWFWYANYTCAYINAYRTAPDEDWLVSPVFNFANQKSGTIQFQQALAYGTQENWPSQCELLISEDYTGNVASATWTRLEIPNWSSSNFSWVENKITIPSAFMHKDNVHFAFHYNVESGAPAWEIKNLTVRTICDNEITTDIDDVTTTEPKARKEIRNGRLIIIRSGVEYTITGQRLY